MLRRVWAEADSNQWRFMTKQQSPNPLVPKCTLVDRDYFDQYGQRRFCNLSMSVAARRPAVQFKFSIPQLAAAVVAECFGCAQDISSMMDIFFVFFQNTPVLSSEVQASASVKGFWLHFSTCGRGARRASLLCRFLPCLATFMKPI